MHVLAELGTQVDDRVNNELPGTMIGHVPTPAGPINRHFPRREHVRLLPGSPERIDMRMFDEQQNVRQRFALLGFDKPLLEFEGGEILHAPEVLVQKCTHEMI
jgi:hypothetical protein